MLRRAAVAFTLLAGITSASAEPALRFGMTTGVNRQIREGAEFGPLVAAGASAGRFVGEASYSYLSMMDPFTGMHRAGVALRANVYTWGRRDYYKTVYAEVGADHRWGSWRVGDETDAVRRTQNEAHVGVGYQLDDKWQLGLRVGLARPDANQPMGCPPGIACRVITMDSPTDLVGSLMVEWMFLLGR